MSHPLSHDRSPLASAVLALALVPPLVAGCNQAFGLDETVVAKPNYYTCDCDCSHRVIAAQGSPVLAGPGQLPVRQTLSAAREAEILDGPVETNTGGTPANWWQVRFDSQLQGWVQETLLTLSNTTLVTKKADTCVPPEFNPNLGGTVPTIADLQPICSGEVADEARATVNDKLAPLGRFDCRCYAQSLGFSEWNSSCDAPCPDGGDVCLLAGSDPPEPTPTLMSEALLVPTSECRVTGDAWLSAGGHEPKTQPSVHGVVQIQGRPCPAGQGCLAGMAYQLRGDDIEFDSGSIFASDPKFVDLALSGSTEPEVIALGPLLGGHIGEVPEGTALSSLRARRSGELEPFGLDGRNAAGIALLVTWQNKTCRIAGELIGQAVGDEGEGTVDAQLEVLLDGVIENQPPRPNAGADQTVECTSESGASVTLDASGTTDADGNIAFYEWRVGSGSGAQLAAPSAEPGLAVQQALGQQSYHLLVADSRFSADVDSVQVDVVDTTAPQISCNAPATIVPSDVPEKKTQGISFTATASDLCSGVSAVRIESYSCTKPRSCIVGFQGDTLTIYDSGGVGDIIRWSVVAEDGFGNAQRTTCELTVVQKNR